MSPVALFTRRYQYPIMLGSILMGCCVAFRYRYELLGDLEPGRAILMKEDKEARAICEAAIKEAQKS